MTDDEFMASFENCSLSNESFHHSDHAKMAFLYLSRYPALEALQRFSVRWRDSPQPVASPAFTTKPSHGLSCS
jgi:hypothetical protein